MTKRALLLAASLGLLLPARVAYAQAGGPQPGSQGPMTLERVVNGPAFMPEVKFTELDGHSSGLVGASGGWLLDNTFLIGAGGYWLVNGDERSLGYGGLVLQWLQGTNRRVGFAARGLVGGGWAELPSLYTYYPYVPGHRPTPLGTPTLTTVRVLVNRGVFIAEPQADLLVNLSPHMRFNWSVGYRLVGADGDFDSRLRGFTASFGFQIGGGSTSNHP